MPKTEPAGKHPGYSASPCLQWKVGHTIATARKIEMTPVQKIAVGWVDVDDNCPLAANPQQEAADGVDDACNNCAITANPDQRDTDENGVGNQCTAIGC